jgi:hypothetical protein
MSLNKPLTHNFASTAVKLDRDISQEILRVVEELKQGSGFGSIEIVLHEGRVTQIEKREKLRFNHPLTHDKPKTTPTAPASVK